MRLKTLLATSFALLTLGGSLAGSLTVEQMVSARLHTRVGRDMAQAATQVRNQLEANLVERLSDMQVLAHVARTTAPSAEERRPWLEPLRRIYPVYSWIGFARRDGTVEASTGGLLEGQDVSRRPWFQAGLSAHFFGDLHEAKLLADLLPREADGEPLRFLDVAAPLHDPNGEVVGVVGAHLSARWVSVVTREALEMLRGRNPDLRMLVLTSEGEIVLGAKDLDGAVPRDLVDAVRSAARADGAHSVETWSDGRAFLVGTARSLPRTDRPTLGWTVLVLQPAWEALAPSRQISLQILGVGTMFAVAAALAGWWLAGRIARPLLNLSQAAVALGDRAGGLPPPAGFTEARQLTASIDALLARLSQRDAALAAANRDLEARVASRTRDLEVERSRAEAAMRAKADFLANMSHELRTPLTGMLGVHQILRDDAALAGSQRRLVELAHEAGRSLLVIVNDVLDVSKMDAGQLAIEKVAFDLRHLVEACRRIGVEGAPSQDLVVRTEIARDLPARLLADPTRLRQILLNLITNAVKFTPHGSVVIRALAAGGRLRLEVEDTGIGIPPEAVPSLFQRFSQADSSTSRRFGGTGLGLAICKRLAELMGGAIGVSSRPGEGTTFWVELPLEAAPDEARAPLPPARAGAARRLLLVEDNEANREIIAGVLARKGHEVVAASGGQEAVEAVRTGRFDAVLMDVQMPVMDGLMATTAIRVLESRKGRRYTPIVALTANVTPEEAERCRRAGMDAHVGKPVSWDELEAVLDRLCGERRDDPAADAARPAGRAAVPVMDEGVLAILAGHLGEGRIGSLLLSFRSELERRLEAVGQDDVGTAEIAAHAHILVSMAGQLGFAELSSFCAELERTVSEAGRSVAVERLRDLAGRALQAASASRYAA